MSASFPLNSFVDCARIIGAVGHEGGYPIIDLVQQTRHPRTVRRASIGQLGSKDLAGFGVDRQVEFSPNPPLWWLPKVADVNPETCGVDAQMDRPICGKPAEVDVTELLQSPGQCRVIGDWKLYL